MYIFCFSSRHPKHIHTRTHCTFVTSFHGPPHSIIPNTMCINTCIMRVRCARSFRPRDDVRARRADITELFFNTTKKKNRTRKNAKKKELFAIVHIRMRIQSWISCARLLDHPVSCCALALAEECTFIFRRVPLVRVPPAQGRPAISLLFIPSALLCVIRASMCIRVVLTYI